MSAMSLSRSSSLQQILMVSSATDCSPSQKQTDTILSLKSSKVIGKGIYKIQVKAQSPQIKYETVRDITIIVDRNKSLDNRTVLTETFTAKW